MLEIIRTPLPNRKIVNFWSNGNASAGIYFDENNSDWDITENHLYQTGAIAATGGNAHFGIQSLSTDNINITNNYIGGSGEECGGAAWIVSGAFANSFTGISISGGEHRRIHSKREYHK